MKSTGLTRRTVPAGACAPWCVALVAALVAGTPVRADTGPPTVVNPKEYLTIGTEVFRVELAITPTARERGLMKRPDLDPDSGMLFVFTDDETQWFWMAHTWVDLDIFYIDKTGRITAIHRMKTEPPPRPHESETQYHLRLQRYSSRSPVRYALELPAGSLELLKLKVGDTIPLDHDRLHRLAVEAAERERRAIQADTGPAEPPSRREGTDR